VALKSPPPTRSQVPRDSVAGGDRRDNRKDAARMDRQKIGRIVSVLIGAAVLLGLEQGYGIAFYIAIPAAVIAYTAARLAFGLSLGTGDRAQ
jgi:hypothetical protein